jgi:hypothetical protein
MAGGSVFVSSGVLVTDQFFTSDGVLVTDGLVGADACAQAMSATTKGDASSQTTRAPDTGADSNNY